MAYIKLSDNSYPHTERDIRASNPQTSYPASFPCPDGYAVVFPAPQPAHDPITQSVREIAPVIAATGNYEQRWQIVALDAATIAANQARVVEQNNTRLKAEIAVLDLKRVRPLAEGDAAFLSVLNAQVAALRAQLV